MDKYYLNIHYRSIAAAQDAAGASEQASPGHVYVSLKGDGSEEEYFGLYKPVGIFPIGCGKVETENEKQMHVLVKDLSKDTSKNAVFTKQIELTQDQYNKAIAYARKKASEDILYILGFNDCIEFTQSVYNAAGLPLYFSHVYSSDELSKLPNLAAAKMASKYGSRDVKNNVLLVEGFSREDVASRLNLPVDRIEIIPQAPAHSDIAAHVVIKTDNFRVKLNEPDFLPEQLVKTVDNTIQSNETVQDNKVPSSSSIQPQKNSPDEEFNLISLLSSLGLGTRSKVLEQLQELNRLEKKVKELLKEYGVKADDLVKDFIDRKNKVSADKQKCCYAEKDRMLQQIQSDYDSYNQQVFSQKQAELSNETEVALAAARAAAGDSGSFTFSNADIAARKQSEYESLLGVYRSACDTKVQNLQSTFKEKCAELNRAEENEVQNKIDLMKTEAKNFSMDVSVLLQEVKEKVKRGEDINIDSVINNVDAKFSTHFAALKQMVDSAT